MLLSVNGEQNKKTDENICGIITHILCIKDLLTNITTAAKDIRKTAIELEQKIFQQDQTKLRLLTNIQDKRAILRSTFPTSDYHLQLLTMNNIDKEDFIHLIKEQYFAIGYLYNSLQNLRYIQSTLGKQFDNLFNQTQTILQKDILCNYMNILRVYSENWSTIDQINGIDITETQMHELSSLEYNSYLIIIVQLISKWMRCIKDVIDTLEYKLI
ncbi:unnamed protein product [Rotaria sp. Silwood1]|nr:unnamed protein product [Rotaria sp. Silwood1]